MALQIKNIVKSGVLINNFRSLSTVQHGLLNDNKTGTKDSSSSFHVTAKKSYPVAEPLPLPDNINNETAIFSPQRNRDISSSAIFSHQSNVLNEGQLTRIDITSQADPHVQSYDCRGAVNLNCSMQTNVPSPFSAGFTGDHYMHLNMPGGQWEQYSKYVSNDLHSNHYTNLREEIRREGPSIYKKGSKLDERSKTALKSLLSNIVNHQIAFERNMSTVDSKTKLLKETKTTPLPEIEELKVEEKPMSRKEKLKLSFKEYGATGIIFHVSLSLMSLGGFYLLVSSGIDLQPLMNKLDDWTGNKFSVPLTAGAGTFVVSYAIHKVFAPVRMSITIAATPLIVRYLRKINVLKKPTPK